MAHIVELGVGTGILLPKRLELILDDKVDSVGGARKSSLEGRHSVPTRSEQLSTTVALGILGLRAAIERLHLIRPFGGMNHQSPDGLGPKDRICVLNLRSHPRSVSDCRTRCVKRLEGCFQEFSRGRQDGKARIGEIILPISNHASSRAENFRFNWGPLVPAERCRTIRVELYEESEPLGATGK